MVVCCVRMAVLCKSLLNFKINRDIVKISLRWSNTVPGRVVEAQRSSLFNENRIINNGKPQKPVFKSENVLYQEFLPNPDPRRRDKVAEMLERKDMLKRLTVISVPEFYVGSIMAVTITDKYSPDKKGRFVGICIERTGVGLRSNFTLRNVVDGQGMEVTYDTFSPLILKIEVLRLEKRLDNELFYLRDAPLEHSTFPFDMVAIQHPPNEPVPINPLKVKLNPRPWNRRWERQDLKGVEELEITDKMRQKASHPNVVKPWNKYDLMKQYREKINDVEAQDIMSEVYEQISKINKDKDTSLKMNGKSQKAA